MRTRLLAFLVAAAALWTAAPARAAQPCDDPLNLPNPVYLTVGDTQVNLMKAIGKPLRDKLNVTLVWLATGSCTNLGTIYAGTPLTATLSYIPANYDPLMTPTPPTCTPPMAGVAADIANSIVFLDACPGQKPATVADTLGPVQSFVFVVPSASSQTVITAEEAYFVFGFGMAGMATPWIDESQLYVRPVTKGTIISMGASIRVPAAKWKGMQIAQSTSVASGVAMSPRAEAAIGILGSEVYDGYRASLKALAFRIFGQQHAWYPDSTSGSHDRKNVRDGHYHLWSYTHWLINTDAQGAPKKPLAKKVVDLIVGNPVDPAPGFEPLDASIAVGLVPQCAMKVKRTTEGGDFSLDAPAAPCGCYFEKMTGATSCTACVDDSPCGAGKCRHGYCEAR